MNNHYLEPKHSHHARTWRGLLPGLLLVLALPGCGNGDRQPETSGTQEPAPKAAEEDAGPAAQSSAAKQTKADTEQLLRALEQALSDGGPKPFGPFKGVELMKTPLEEIVERYKELGGSKVEGLPGRFSAHSVRGRYEQWPDTANELVISFPGEFDPTPALERAWGEPVAAPDDSGVKVNGKRLDALYWFNANDRVRARLTRRSSTSLHLKPYVPLEQFMGESGISRLGFESGQPLLGSTLAELEEAYGRHLDKNMKSLWFPGLEFDTFLMQVLYRLDDNDRVQSFRFGLRYEPELADKDLKQHFRQAFAEKFGDSESTGPSGKTVLVYSQDPHVELTDRPSMEEWRVQVSER